MIRKTLRALFGRGRFEDGLDSELCHHIELRAADLERSGLSPADAARQARLELGSRERYKDEARAAFGLRWFDDLVHDVRYALRTLRRSPGFAATAILSMTLGVGANTMVVSVMNSLLFRPLPVHQPEQLLFVNLAQNQPNMSYPAYLDLRDRAQTIDGAVAYRVTRMGVGDERSSEKYWGFLASGNYFDVLGIQPAIGRYFHADDEKGGPNASPYVVLSHGLWQSRFQGDPSVIGKTIRVNAAPYTILGVAPENFHGTESAIDPGLWVPMMQQQQIEGRGWLDARANNNIWVIVRSKPGLSPTAVEADLNRVASDLAREHPDTDRTGGWILSKPGLIGNTLRRPLEQAGSAVLLLAGLVLLAACINLAALLGARSADRVKEIALRVSIGAGRARIIRQLLTESVVLTALSGIAGGALGWALLRALSRWHPPTEVALRLDVHPEMWIFLFSAGISIVTGLAAGLVPALQAWKLHTSDALKGAVKVRRGWHLRDASLFVQTALCCLLVVCSLVAARGLTQVFTVRPGLNPQGVSVVEYDTILAGYTREQSQQFQQRALDAVAKLPGAISAAYASTVPLGTNQSNTTVFPESAPEPRNLNEGIRSGFYSVSPGYFQTMGTRLLSGRDFAWNDSPEAQFAIVNETFARRVIGTTQAVGHRFRYIMGAPIEVIGVVEDGKYDTFSEDPKPAIFRAGVRGFGATLIVRSSLPEATMAAEMQRAVKALDPSLPLYGIGTLRERMALALLPAEIAVVVLGVFGLLALMLAVTGIYGLASYSVSRRVREIGIRMAIGARPKQVLQSVLGRLAIVVTAGSVVGIVLGLASGEVLKAVVYQASPRDPMMLAGVGLIMGAVALGSALGPIRRAVSIEPTRALRED